jgi:hypothetical protein
MKEGSRRTARAREAASALSLILVGLCLIRAGVEWVSALGWAAGVLGAARGALLLRSAWADWRESRRIRRERERQERARARRRIRQREREAARALQREQESRAISEREAADRSRDAAERARTQQERALRSDAERRIGREAQRLQGASEEELLASVEQALAGRGLSPVATPDSEPCERLFAAPDGARCLVRCVGDGRKARALDVRAAEDWRRRCGAAHAYLVATGGFRPDAVRAASDIAVTLVDPYLLAHWMVIGAGSAGC